jgi:hypothetical protein
VIDNAHQITLLKKHHSLVGNLSSEEDEGEIELLTVDLLTSKRIFQVTFTSSVVLRIYYLEGLVVSDKHVNFKSQIIHP